MGQPIFKIQGNDQSTLDLAIRLAFVENEKASGYKIDPDDGLTLFRPDHSASPRPFPGEIALPYKHGADDAVRLASAWLAEVDYGKKGSGDGSYVKGFYIHNGDLGYIGADYRAFVAIKPTWIYYGK